MTFTPPTLFLPPDLQRAFGVGGILRAPLIVKHNAQGWETAVLLLADGDRTVGTVGAFTPDRFLWVTHNGPHRDIWLAAKVMVEPYYGNAGIEAAKRADELLEKGDPEGSSVGSASSPRSRS